MRKVNLPDGISGDWKIEKFTVEKPSARFSTRIVPPGEYTRLMYKDEVVMADTPDEMRDHMIAENMATKSILINGLGIGMFLQACLDKPEVTDITVIENSKDVINLVAPHYTDSRVNIIHADAFSYQPPKGKRYQVVWHDIWTYICGDNLEEMKKLHRKYGRRCDWQASWCRELCERQNKQYNSYYG